MSLFYLENVCVCHCLSWQIIITAGPIYYAGRYFVKLSTSTSVWTDVVLVFMLTLQTFLTTVPWVLEMCKATVGMFCICRAARDKEMENLELTTNSQSDQSSWKLDLKRRPVLPWCTLYDLITQQHVVLRTWSQKCHVNETENRWKLCEFCNTR